MKTIKEHRKSRGWSQQNLATWLNVTPVSVYNWERGQHMPTAVQLRQIAQAFRVSMDDIDFWSPYEAKHQTKTAPEPKPERRRTSAPGSGEDGA